MINVKMKIYRFKEDMLIYMYIYNINNIIIYIYIHISSFLLCNKFNNLSAQC